MENAHTRHRIHIQFASWCFPISTQNTETPPDPVCNILWMFNVAHTQISYTLHVASVVCPWLWARVYQVFALYHFLINNSLQFQPHRLLVEEHAKQRKQRMMKTNIIHLGIVVCFQCCFLFVCLCVFGMETGFASLAPLMWFAIHVSILCNQLLQKLGAHTHRHNKLEPIL